MKASFFAAGTMPAELVRQGTDFLRRRFFESWNITRSDISNELLFQRHNLVMLAGDSIAAWLGIEADGELTNACVERGYRWQSALRPLILQAFAWDENHAAFAFVPAEKLASAYIFMSLGMVFPAGDQVCVKRISYPERSILLVKIVLISNKAPQI
jgi:hypothetical protein